MGRYDGLLICSDFDGTLCYRGEVSRENRDAIRRFRAGGGRFTLATGRYPGHVLELMGEDVDRSTPMICLNGGLLCDLQRNAVLFRGVMPRGYDRILLQLTQREGIRSFLVYPADEWAPISCEPQDRDQLCRLMARDVIKIMVRVEDAVSDAVKEWMTVQGGADYCVARSWINGIEAQGAAYDKGIVARKLATMLSADTLICVGDYENDLSMIREADIGVAMGNAVAELKGAADLTTGRVEEHGIAQLIESL